LPRLKKDTLATYCDEIEHWNKKINLTGLAGAEMVRRLVVEPAWIGLQLKPKGVLADIGSGNGAPAIPLHVVCEFQACHLIEARTKRAAFLRHVVSTLRLPNARVHHARFSSVDSNLDKPGWITVQGVALTHQLLDAIRRFISSSTTVVWVTSSAVQPAAKPSRILRVPFTDTQVFLFQLDLS